MKLVGYDSDSVSDDLDFKPKIKLTANKTGRCWYCKTTLDSTNYTRDHVHPKSLGGTKTKSCCLPCNREKANMTLVQYIAFLKLKANDSVTLLKISNAKKLLKNNYGSL